MGAVALWGVFACAHAAPVAGRHVVSLCTLPPAAPELCSPAVAQVKPQGEMVVHHPKAQYTITFPSKYKQARVKVREKGRPSGEFLADYEWKTPQVFHFSETQPTQWEVRFEAPAAPQR